MSSRWCCNAPEIKWEPCNLNVLFAGDGVYIHFSLYGMFVFAHCAVVCTAESSSLGLDFFQMK